MGDVCDTDGQVCDYCGNFTEGGPGSDTWYDATCSLGECSGAVTDCIECESCRIESGYVGLCDPDGVNRYIDIEDVVLPNTCDGTLWCVAGAGCVEKPP